MKRVTASRSSIAARACLASVLAAATLSAACGGSDSPVNRAPVARAGPDQNVFVGDVATLDGSGSYDLDGDALTYSWTLTSPSGSTAALSGATTAGPTFTPDRTGSYGVRLVVSDGKGGTATDSVIVTAPNRAPVASAGPDQNVSTGNLVTLDGSGSYDLDGDALTYSWTLTSPSGSTAALSGATTVSPTFTPDLAGSYEVQLVVNDGTADSAPDPVTVTATVGDIWNSTSLTGAPSARTRHTAVWTGTEMIVWGGRYGSVGLGTGGRYDPATDSWTAISTAGAPSARYRHVAVWTGSTMLVWGGENASVTNTGGVYDPATDTWTAMSTTGAPQARTFAEAVWTGTKMIVWGGHDGASTWLSSGGAYDPATNTWTAVSTTGAPSPRAGHTAVWTGAKMIVWGGYNGSTYLGTGGVYDPATDSWTATSGAGAPSGRSIQSAVWTGSGMIVWGGVAPGPAYPTSGGTYDPATDSWTATATTGAPTGRSLHTGTWTGTKMVIWGGEAPIPVNTGGRYTPGTWTGVTTTGAPAARSEHTAVWTGAEVIVWGGLGAATEMESGGRYRP